MTIRTVPISMLLGLLLCFAVGGSGCARRQPQPAASPGENATFPSPSGPGGRHFVDRPPVGWRKTPVDPAHFRYSIDRNRSAQGKVSARIDGTAAADERVASISQRFPAISLAGRTVRVVAQVRQKGIEDWAHMWVSVRAAGGIGLAADRVPLEKIRGDREWRRLEAEVDVPLDADNFSLGFVLVGEGTFWIDDVRILDENGDALASPLRNGDFESHEFDEQPQR